MVMILSSALLVRHLDLEVTEYSSRGDRLLGSHIERAIGVRVWIGQLLGTISIPFMPGLWATVCLLARSSFVSIPIPGEPSPRQGTVISGDTYWSIVGGLGISRCT